MERPSLKERSLSLRATDSGSVMVMRVLLYARAVLGIKLGFIVDSEKDLG